MKNIIYLAVGLNQIMFDKHLTVSDEPYSLTEVDFYNFAASHMCSFALGNTELQLISYLARLKVGNSPYSQFPIPIEQTRAICDFGRLVVQHEPKRLEDLLIALKIDATALEGRLTREPV